ncbi:MAG: hypothetical protein PVG39_00405 [Desulfobacteraceae bacterium]|jgi:hypothetical protein
MPKIDIKIGIYSSKGFSEEIYRNESIIGDNSKKFTTRDLINSIEFLKRSMIEFNKGKRGVRNGRNYEGITETEEENADSRKVREIVREIEERFQGEEQKG